MFKKTSVNPQYDMFSTPSTQMGKREAKKYDDPRAWHNRFYANVTSQIDETIFAPLFKQGKMGAPNASIRVIIGMSIIKEGFGCSDEDLFDKCQFDLLVRKALGLVALSVPVANDLAKGQHTHQLTMLHDHQRTNIQLAHALYRFFNGHFGGACIKRVSLDTQDFTDF